MHSPEWNDLCPLGSCIFRSGRCRRPFSGIALARQAGAVSQRARESHRVRHHSVNRSEDVSMHHVTSRPVGRLLLTLAALASAALLAACGSDNGTGVNSGSIQVTSATTGADVDSSGYSVVVDNGSGHAIGISDSATISSVQAGSHQVVLASVGSNCTVSPSDTQTVTVTAGSASAVSFQVSCVLRQIVFASFPADSGDIFTIADDGTGSHVLASSPSFDGLPSWSPNRQLIAFASSRQHTGHG